MFLIKQWTKVQNLDRAMSQALEKVQNKEVTPDLAAEHSGLSSYVDLVKVKANNDVILDEDGNIRDVDVNKTFIDNVNKHKVVSDTEGEEEVNDDIRVSIESVQKAVHGVAESVGEDKPTTSAPRDMATSFQFLHQAVSLKIQVSECPNLHLHGNFCTDL